MTIRSAGGQSGLRRHKALLVLLVLAALLAGAAVGWAAYLNHQISAIPRIDLGPDTSSAAGPDGGSGTEGSGAGQAVNILLAGVDAGESSRIADELARGPWVPGSHRTDTIMVVHLTADRGQAYVVSVPRDTWVPIDGHGMAKINAAFSFGGPSLFVRTLEQFTGLRMDHLAIVDWQGLERLTDALGGVTLEQADGGATSLDGKAALRYVRERYSLPRGDLDRMQRQQNLLRALSDQLRSEGTLANPLRLTRAVKAMTGNIVVDDDMTNEKIRSLALSLRHLRDGSVVHVTTPVKRFDEISSQSVVIVDRDEARGLFGAVMADELPEYLQTHEVDVLPDAALVP